MLTLGPLVVNKSFPFLHRMNEVQTDDSYGFSYLYDDLYAWPAAVLEAVEAVVRRHGSPILELGCGTGSISIYLANRDHQCVMVERSNAMISQAARRIEGLPDPVRNHLQLIQSDLRFVPLNQTFPCVLSLGGVFSFLPHRDAVLDALDRLKEFIADGGVAYVDVFNPQFWSEFTQWKQGQWRYWYATEGPSPFHIWLRTLPGPRDRMVRYEKLIAGGRLKTYDLCRTETNDFTVAEWREFIGAAGLRLETVFSDWTAFRDGRPDAYHPHHGLITFKIRAR